MTVPAAEEEFAVNLPLGETLTVLERVIVAPSAGAFRRLNGPNRIHDGDVINRGSVIGAIQSLAASTPVQSPFDGMIVAFLACEGERLYPGQPVAWLRMI